MQDRHRNEESLCQAYAQLARILAEKTRLGGGAHAFKQRVSFPAFLAHARARLLQAAPRAAGWDSAPKADSVAPIRSLCRAVAASRGRSISADRVHEKVSLRGSR